MVSVKHGAVLMLLAMARSVRAVRMSSRVTLGAHASQSWRLGVSPALRMMCGSAPTDIPTVDENGVPLSKNAIKKLQKAAALAQKKAQKVAAKSVEQQDAATTVEGDEATEEAPAMFSFSTPGLLMSDAAAASSTRVYSAIHELGAASGPAAGAEVWVRGRLYRVRGKGNQCFLVLRERGQFTVQACFFHDKSVPTQSKAMLAFLQVWRASHSCVASLNRSD